MKIGIISDLHCDLQALETALKELRGVDQVICAGDLNLQYRFSNEISELMQRYQIPVVRGNHDTAILSSAGLMLRNSGQIKPQNLSHLRQMPLVLEWPIEGKRVMMMHTSPLDPTGGEHGGRPGVFLPGEGDRLAPPPVSEDGGGGMVAGGGTDDNASAAGRLAKIPNHMLPESKADVLIVGQHAPNDGHVRGQHADSQPRLPGAAARPQAFHAAHLRHPRHLHVGGHHPRLRSRRGTTGASVTPRRQLRRAISSSSPEKS